MGKAASISLMSNFLYLIRSDIFENFANRNDFAGKNNSRTIFILEGWDSKYWIKSIWVKVSEILSIRINDFKWYSQGIVPIFVFEWYYRSYRFVKKCLRVSGNVFGTSKCLQQSFKDFKNLQTVQIVIRTTLTTVTSVLSKHILHTLSNVSPPIGRSGDDP